MRALGAEGEELAVKYLLKKGYRILERNFVSRSGEIDIIAGDGEVIVFIEVKTRSEGRFGRFGPPEMAVDSRKQRKIRRAALHYISRLKKEPAARFDVISICLTPAGKEIEHIADAYC